MIPNMSGSPEPDLLVHIGYARTGSTWLQRCFFNNPSVGFVLPFSREETIRQLVFPRVLGFDASECRKRMLPALIATVEEGLMPVISRERLSGYPHSGGHDSKEMADRLLEVFPTARVLVVIREQKTMILSAYKHYVRTGGPCTLAGYLEPPFSCDQVPKFEFSHFEYHLLVNHYFNLFGRSNVLVLPFELFEVRPMDFLKEILRFCGLEARTDALNDLPHSQRVNQNLSAGSVAVKRHLNWMICGKNKVQPWVLLPISVDANARLNAFLRRLDWAMPHQFKSYCEGKLQAAVAALVGDRYRRSNALTARLLNTDLSHYGHDVD